MSASLFYIELSLIKIEKMSVLSSLSMSFRSNLTKAI